MCVLVCVEWSCVVCVCCGVCVEWSCVVYVCTGVCVVELCGVCVMVHVWSGVVWRMCVVMCVVELYGVCVHMCVLCPLQCSEPVLSLQPGAQADLEAGAQCGQYHVQINKC